MEDEDPLEASTTKSIGFSSKECEEDDENVGVFGGGTLGLSLGATTLDIVVFAFFASDNGNVNGGMAVEDLPTGLVTVFLSVNREESLSSASSTAALCVVVVLVVVVVVVLEMTVVVTPPPLPV